MARIHNILGTTKRTSYRPFEIRSMPEREIRKAYSDLRAIAVKRLARLEKAGLETELSPSDFPKIKDLSPEQLRERLASVSAYVRRPESRVPSARKIQEQKEQTLKRSGYDVSDMKSFGKFMEAARVRQKGRAYDSASAATLYEALEKVYVKPEKLQKYFETWLNSAEKAYTGAERLEAWAASHPDQTLTLKDINNVLRGRNTSRD